jgi:AcrR family transcriptional regulator
MRPPSKPVRSPATQQTQPSSQKAAEARAMSQVRRSRSGGTRQKILDAAMAEIREKGFFDTSVDAIAERAGLSKMAIYYHFESKATLCVEAITTSAKMRANRLAKEIENCDTILHALECAVDIIWDDYVGLAPGFQSLFLDLRRTDPDIRVHFEREMTAYTNVIREIVVAGQAKGEIIPGHPSLLALFFISAIGSSASWYDPAGPVNPTAFRRLLRSRMPALIIRR